MFIYTDESKREGNTSAVFIIENKKITTFYLPQEISSYMAEICSLFPAFKYCTRE